MYCDFCDLPGPTRTFEAADVLIDLGSPVVLHESLGGWAACQTCGTLIDAHDRDGLVQRSYEAFARDHPEAATPEVLDMIRTVHVAFWQGRL